MCLAVTATDAVTAARLEMRLSPGTTWVSHLLQRVTHSVMTDEDALTLIDEAATHYADRNTAFAELLSDRGLATTAGDGMSLWITLPAPARDVAERLTRRGWLVRTGDEFRLEPSDEPSPHLRLTVHDLSHEDATTLATDIADVVGEIASTIGP
jgi:DNA-binding transcriptional MocR family regulator